MRSVTRFSPAKINLTLAVGPVRPDGFHPIESVVSRLDFGDFVTLTERSDGRVVVECAAAGIPTDDSNLAARAAARLRDELRSGGVESPGVTIRLEKRIPAGAGLGGGSSNAAATLLGLRELWNLNVPMARIASVGAEIGSDVPLFLAEPNRMIVMRGRGEEIELCGHPLAGQTVLLAIPPIHSPTAGVYRRFDELPAPPPRPTARVVIDSLSRENPMSLLFNDLQPAAESLNPALGAFRERIACAANRPFLMTGSGAAYFTLLAENAGAEDARLESQLKDSPGAATIVRATMI